MSSRHQYRHRGFIYLLFFLFLLAHCSNAIRERRLEEEVNWQDHPEVVLAFSKAMVDGIRILMDELLISESWFANMDVSIFAEKTELLQGRILNLSLQGQSKSGLVTSWRVFQSKSDAISYITTTSFGDTSSTNSDSLYLDIYGQTIRRPTLPATIDLVYWRDAEDEDAVARLRMAMTPDSLYIRQ